MYDLFPCNANRLFSLFLYWLSLSFFLFISDIQCQNTPLPIDLNAVWQPSQLDEHNETASPPPSSLTSTIASINFFFSRRLRAEETL